MIENTFYIYFFHGRHQHNQEMNDWGFEGPLVGPLSHVGWTYDRVKLCNNDELHHLDIQHGMVVIDGKFYGDFRVVAENELRYFEDTKKISLEEFMLINKCV